jgi:hypothetical protein
LRVHKIFQANKIDLYIYKNLMDMSDREIKKNLKNLYDLLMRVNLEGWRLFFKKSAEKANPYLYYKNAKYGVAIKTCLHNRDLIGAKKWFNKYKKHSNEVIEKFENTEDIFAINKSNEFEVLADNNEDRYLKICDVMKQHYELFERYIEILEYKLKHKHF